MGAMYIPKSIIVGYQNRRDTYTGKLAYVIYRDEKNKLRKENSWNSWRDESIDPNTFFNAPTSGFVLNKKVGDYSGYWGEHRQAYCRIYDPRGFEFEITIENLLFILENATSTKGKGLEGEFVYAWDGKDLILLPCDSPDYKSISEFSNIVNDNSKIKSKELKVGATYLTKQNTKLIYMGKFDYWVDGYKKNNKVFNYFSDMARYCRNNNIEPSRYEERYYSKVPIYDPDESGWFVIEKRHIFCSFRNNGEVEFLDAKNISGWIIKCLDSECCENYAELFDELESCSFYSPVDSSKDKLIPYSYNEIEKLFVSIHYSSRSFYMNDIPNIGFTIRYEGYLDKYKVVGITQDSFCEVEKDLIALITEKTNCILKKEGQYYSTGYMKLSEIVDKFKPAYKELYLKNGRFLKKRCFYEE